jgi:hypothetical protein
MAIAGERSLNMFTHRDGRGRGVPYSLVAALFRAFPDSFRGDPAQPVYFEAAAAM